MSVFDKIKEAIWGKSEQPTTKISAASKPLSAQTIPSPSIPAATPKPVAQPAPQLTLPSDFPTAGADRPAAPKQPVDVEAVLEEAVRGSGQKLDWRLSIVDLMKALDLDSSLTNRKELADELGYTGDKGDSAAMNIWLHKALMKRLSENGGKVPADLAD